MDKILQAIHDELVLSYTQAGRVVPTTVAIVAAALMDAIKFSDDEEVHESFKRARMMADVPTQRVLNEALCNFRAEHRAYQQRPSEAPRLTHPGSKIVTNEETKYIMATQRIAGTFPYMDLEEAKSYAKEFEADPKNREMVEYQRGWIKNFMDSIKHSLEMMEKYGIKANVPESERNF